MALTSSRASSWPRLSLFFRLSIALQMIASCFAQEDSPATASITTAALSSSLVPAPTQTHTIKVGLADHKFVPNVTEAAVGDTLEFRFYPLNHSVVRADYLMPCIPYEMSGPSRTGFFSGFHPVDKVLEDAPAYRIVVNDTNPIFFYCSAPGSCLNYGMVGAVNPASDQDIEQQSQKAKNSAYMLNPGEPFPAEGSSGGGNITSSTGEGNGGGTVADTTRTGAHGLSKGAIAGIVVAAIVVVVLAALLFFFWGRTKSLEDEVDRKAGTVRRVSSGQGQSMMQQRTPTSTVYDMNHDHNNNTPATRHSAMDGLATLPYTTQPSNHYNGNDSTNITTTTPSSPSPAEMFHHHHSNYTPYHHPPPATYIPTPKFDTTTTSPPGHPAFHPSSLFSHPIPSPNLLPSYFETVHRPSPLHVNEQMGPAEMEARGRSRSRSGSRSRSRIRDKG